MFPLALIGEAIVLGTLLLAGAGYFAHRYAKDGAAGDVMSLPSRLVLTVVMLGFFGYAKRSLGGEGVGTFVMVILWMVFGVLLAVLWLPTLVSLVLGPMFGSMTGGDQQVELKPVYYRGIGRRKRGESAAAIEAVRAELEKFPGDAEGLLLLVEIYADDVKDPRAALAVLDELLTTSGRAPAERALALSRRADVQLKHLNDAEGARVTLETLVAEFAGSEAAHLAQQRLAHLPGGSSAGEKPEAHRLVVKHHEERLGLTEDLGVSQLPVEDATRSAQELLRHLDEFPDDWEARERLARLYVEPLGHLMLATDQLERLIAQPGAPARHVVRWLNELADLQIKTDDGVPAARLTLERLVSKFPGSPWATQAEGRLRHLVYDERAKHATRTIKLGHYEQNLGLKRGDPSIPDPAKSGETELPER